MRLNIRAAALALLLALGFATGASAQKISADPAAAALSGAEYLAGVQSGANVKITPNQIAAFVAAMPRTGAGLSAAETATFRSAISAARAPFYGGAYTLTGTTTKTAIATIALPANPIGANGTMEVMLHAWLATAASASTKVITVELDGVLLYTGSFTSTSLSYQMPVLIHAMGAQNVQSVFTANYTSAYAASPSAHVASAVDLSVAKTLVVYGQLSSGSDSLTIKTTVRPIFIP